MEPRGWSRYGGWLGINGEEFGKLYTKKPALGTAGVAFYDGKSESEADREARLWIESIVNTRSPAPCLNRQWLSPKSWRRFIVLASRGNRFILRTVAT